MGRRRRRNRHPKRYCTLDFLECTGYTKQGKGIVIFKDKEFHVDELIKGEKARIQVYYEEDNLGTARAIKLENESPDRALPLGHWKFSMGSYQIPHLSDEAQDAFKQSRVNSYFENAKKIKVGKRTYYRNKASLTDGGFMAPGKGRKRTIKPDKFDLMDIDFKKYEDNKGVTIIRNLKTSIEGKPGTKIFCEDEVLGKKFRVGLDSFYQVNSEMSELAYKEIISFVPKDSIVFDLFGGAATIAIHLADIAKKVYSVEINKDSHLDALENIKINNTNNIEAICGDANTFANNLKVKPDVIVIDPARAGLAEDSIKSINESDAKRIIYLSCNIDTQARDIKGMTNYNITHVQPYDFFPQTFHIENLIILDKK